MVLLRNTMQSVFSGFLRLLSTTLLTGLACNIKLAIATQCLGIIYNKSRSAEGLAPIVFIRMSEPEGAPNTRDRKWFYMCIYIFWYVCGVIISARRVKILTMCR